MIFQHGPVKCQLIFPFKSCLLSKNEITLGISSSFAVINWMSLKWSEWFLLSIRWMFWRFSKNSEKAILAKRKIAVANIVKCSNFGFAQKLTIWLSSQLKESIPFFFWCHNSFFPLCCWPFFVGRFVFVAHPQLSAHELEPVFGDHHLWHAACINAHTT